MMARGVIGPLAMSGDMGVVNPWVRYHVNDATRAPLVDANGTVHVACVAVDGLGAAVWDRSDDCEVAGAEHVVLVAVWPVAGAEARQWVVGCNFTSWQLLSVGGDAGVPLVSTALPTLSTTCSERSLGTVTSLLLPGAETGKLLLSGVAAAGTYTLNLQTGGDAVVAWSRSAVTTAAALSQHAGMLALGGPAGLTIVRPADGKVVATEATASASAIAVVDPAPGNSSASSLIVASNGTHVHRFTLTAKGALPVGGGYRWNTTLLEYNCSARAQFTATGVAVDVPGGVIAVGTTSDVYGAGGGLHTLRLSDGTTIASYPPSPPANSTWIGCSGGQLGVLDLVVDGLGALYTIQPANQGVVVSSITNITHRDLMYLNVQGGSPRGLSVYGNGTLLVAYVSTYGGSSRGFGAMTAAPSPLAGERNTTWAWMQPRHDSSGSASTLAVGPDPVDGLLPERSWRTSLGLFRSPSVLVDGYGNLHAPCAVIHPTGVPLLLQTSCNWTLTTTNYQPSLFALQPGTQWMPSRSDEQWNAFCWGNLAEVWVASPRNSILETGQVFSPFTDCSLAQLVGTNDPTLQLAFLGDAKQRITALTAAGYQRWARQLPSGPAALQQVLVAPSIGSALFRYANMLVVVDAGTGATLSNVTGVYSAALVLPDATSATGGGAESCVLVTGSEYCDLRAWQWWRNGTLTPMWTVLGWLVATRCHLTATEHPNEFILTTSSTTGVGAVQRMSAANGSILWSWQPGQTRSQPSPVTPLTYVGNAVTDATGHTYAAMFRGTLDHPGVVVYDSLRGTVLGGLTGFTGQLAKAVSLGRAGQVVVATEAGYTKVGPPIVAQSPAHDP